jgi:protoheme IX farnesyltransferase
MHAQTLRGNANLAQRLTRGCRQLLAFGELAKPQLTVLVLFGVAAGFVLGSPGRIGWGRLLCTLIGTALAAAGANGLNQWLERQSDARMLRTRTRPLPSGRLRPPEALAWSMLLAIAGPALLASHVSGLAAALASSAEAIYVCIYTPLKRRTSLCTLAGALAGAIPPMIGWVAAADGLDVGAWILAAALFLWQVPHFLALGWMHRRDYARAGLRILPVVDPTGRATCLAIVLYSLALLPVALTAALCGVAGPVYAAASAVLGGVLVALAVRLDLRRTARNARLVFVASVVYLPLVLGLMMADRGSLGPAPPPILAGTRTAAPAASCDEPPAPTLQQVQVLGTWTPDPSVRGSERSG